LYKDAAEMLPGDRKIRDKSGLVTALRNMTADNAAARLRESSSVRDGPPPLAAEEGPERPMSATTRSLVDLEAAVIAATRKLNTLRDEAERKTKQADKLESDLQAAKSENKALDVKQTPEGAQIAALEAEIERVETAFYEKDYRRRQLELMERRLSGNATAMDAHIKSMEDGLAVSSKELVDIRGYLRQLENGKDQAMHELEAFNSRMEEEQQRRELELAGKRAEFEQAKRAEAWRRQRESVRAELAAELAGDLSKEQEDELKATKAEKERLHRELEIERREREERAAALHEAFQQIKGITGVATLDEMAERFLGHEAARESLQTEREEAEQRLAAARAAVAKAEAELSELRATGHDTAGRGGADADATQEAFASAEQALKEGRARLRRLTTASDRVQSMVVAIRQGAAGVAQRLKPFERFLEPADHSGILDSVALSPQTADAFGFADRGSLASPVPGESGLDGLHAPPSPAVAPGVGAGALAGGRVDVQKQGREAYRLLSTSMARLNRLVGLVEAAVSEGKHHRGQSKRGSTQRRRRKQSVGSVEVAGADDAAPVGMLGGAYADAAAATGSDDDDDGSDGQSGYSSYDSDDPRLLAKVQEQERKDREIAAAARERAMADVTSNAPAFTLFGMRGRAGKESEASVGARRAKRSSDVKALPLKDPVPHANNIRVKAAAGLGDQGSVAGSVASSARSKVRGGGGGGGMSVAGGSPRGDGANGEADGDSDDGKSIVSAGGGKAAVRAARRRKRRKQEELPTHRLLKDAARKRLQAKQSKQDVEAYREKHRDKIEAETARKQTLAKLTKTTRAPTGMDFLTRMPKLL
jgi:hypothetical protein